LRLNVIVLLRLSPNVDRICEVGEKVAVRRFVRYRLGEETG